MKTCKKCRMTKNLEDYYVSSGLKDGLNPLCKSCVKAKSAAFQERTRNDGPKICPVPKICRKCGVLKEIDAFYLNMAASDGLQSKCSACHIAETTNRKAKRVQKDAMAEKAAELLSNAKRRSKQFGLDIDLDVAWIRSQFVDKCPVIGVDLVYDGKKTSPGTPTLDRFHPHLGYLKTNTFLISNLANCVKNSATEEQVMKVANWMECVDVGGGVTIVSQC